MALTITRKTRTILLIILGVLVVAGGGFLIWRVTREETVAPEDSEASGASECEDRGCYWHYALNICTGSGRCRSATGNCYSNEFFYEHSDGQTFCCHKCPNPVCTGCSCTVTCSGDYPLESCPEGHNCSSSVKTCTKVDSCGKACGGTNEKTCYRDEGVSTYTVIYNANGGSCTPNSRTVEFGKTSAAPTCTRSGYNVAGFTRTSGSGGSLNKTTGAITNVSGNQTIQVSWSKTCGDGTCGTGENAENCPVDCPASCGDGFCSTPDENSNNCLQDCLSDCGDGLCTAGEDAESCSVDCPASCGDGLCTDDEDALTCNKDCESVCGDNLCTQGEDVNNCSIDCGEPVAQGGGTVPDTGLLDTVIGRISLGVSFIFLGGLVSQYSRINYFFNSISESQRFRKEVRKQRRKEEKTLKQREKLERKLK
jgi:hypothetical protein